MFVKINWSNLSQKRRKNKIQYRNMPKLVWVGKEKVVSHHQEVPFRVLKHQYNFTASDGNSPGNKIIHGDNLEALKSLLPEYEGKIKCVYIDPPYNTGNEGWIYNDNVNDEKIKKWLGQVVGKEGEDLSRHDKWLCMMYPRLKLLNKLLADDGVFLISIDDYEVHNLRILLNEIFGTHNFIAQLVWDKTRKNDAKLFSVGHEYLIVFAKSLSKLKGLNTIWREQKAGAREIVGYWKVLQGKFGDDFEQIQTALREWYKSLPKNHPSKKLSRYKWVDKFGPWRDRDISWTGGGGPRYDVIHPITQLPCAVPERGWGFATSQEMERQINLGLVVFREDDTKPPIRKAHLLPIAEELDNDDLNLSEIEENDEDESNEADEAGLQVMSSVFNKQAQVSVKLLRKIFSGKKVFPNPKDHEVLMRMFNYVTSKDSIFLDSFAGSGTTAHAVLKLNQEDGGNRKFILIETMDYAETITAERVRRVMQGYGENSKAVEGLGGAFDFYEIGERIFLEDGNLNEAVGTVEIRRYVAFSENIPAEKQLAPANEYSPYLLGLIDKTAYFFIYEKEQTTTLDLEFLADLPFKPNSAVIYADNCLLTREFLQKHNIIFKKIPREITRF